MKKFFELWKKYRAVAVVAAILSGGTGMVYVNTVDGLSVVHDQTRAALGKSPVEVPQEVPAEPAAEDRK